MSMFLRNIVLHQNDAKHLVKFLATFHLHFKDSKTSYSQFCLSDRSIFQPHIDMRKIVGMKCTGRENMPSAFTTILRDPHCYLCHMRQYSNASYNSQLLIQQFVLNNLSSVDSRRKYSQSIKPWKSDLFASFLTSLVDEYRLLIEKMSIEKLNEAKILRLQFLKPVIAVVEQLQAKQSEISDLEKLTQEETDKEMKGLLEDEMSQFHQDAEHIEAKLVDTLVGEDLADSNDIVLEVSAGVGGQEAMLFCAEVFNMYYNYSLFKGWMLSPITEDVAEGGGFRKASMEIGGKDVYKHLKHEAGVHRVQRVPKTERQGRIHTSTISVSVVPKPREIDIVVNAKDLKVETMRASGPGGQSVNTTDSAVRITHLPTGTVSECKQERSQIKNKEIAMDRLKMRMYTAKLEAQEAKRRATRKMQMGSRGRSEKIRTYNFQQDRISDHRVKGNLNNIHGFMMGGEELDDLLASLELEEKYSALQSMIDEHEQTERKTMGKS